MAELMRYEEFVARRAQACTLQALQGDVIVAAAVEAHLVDVGARLEQQGFEQFSLLFEVEAIGSAAAQGMYRLTFLDDAVTQELFLVPLNQAGSLTTCEAVFNRSAAVVLVD